MVIENRNLAAGTILAGRYKGKRHECTVLESEGVKAYSLEDGSIHKSPSAAASKLMGGGSVNGWRFWSLAADLQEKSAKETKTAPTSIATKMVKVIKKMPNQKGVAQGSTKFWCSSCMKSFVAETTLVPEACPDGHARETADEFAVPKEASSPE